jgi:hypothetical protein
MWFLHYNGTSFRNNQPQSHQRTSDVTQIIKYRGASAFIGSILNHRMTRLIGTTIMTVGVIGINSAHAQGLAGMVSTGSTQAITSAGYIKDFCYLAGGVFFLLAILNIRKDQPEDKKKAAFDFLFAVLAFGASTFSQRIAQTVGLSGSHASGTL